ncbi:Cyclin-dependent kinases regulatory subunit (Cell division control protein cks1) [Cryptotrichosporon argae]
MSRARTYTAEERRRAIEQYHSKINYSDRYADDEWEYRHVILPKALVKFCPPGVLSEDVWRGLGVRQSLGWEMYMRHEPHVLLFRRPKEPVRAAPIERFINPAYISARN